jgi:hypothetical protein
VRITSSDCLASTRYAFLSPFAFPRFPFPTCDIGLTLLPFTSCFVPLDRSHWPVLLGCRRPRSLDPNPPTVRPRRKGLPRGSTTRLQHRSLPGHRYHDRHLPPLDIVFLIHSFEEAYTLFRFFRLCSPSIFSSSTPPLLRSSPSTTPFGERSGCIPHPYLPPPFPFSIVILLSRFRSPSFAFFRHLLPPLSPSVILCAYSD